MSPNIKPLIAGNWKMNGMRASLSQLSEISKGYDAGAHDRFDMLICVPFTLIHAASRQCVEAGSAVMTGGQDCHFNRAGAHTGDISAEMIADCGGTAVIVGHSERRMDHGETNAIIKAKAQAAMRVGLLAILCIGETRSEREAGKTLEVLGEQLENAMPDGATAANVVVAYEPVWAIGTGLLPSPQDVAKAHAFMRDALTGRFGEQGAHMRLLYGGSVKPENATQLMGTLNVDGALVGGASLKAEDFLGICKAYDGWPPQETGQFEN